MNRLLLITILMVLMATPALAGPTWTPQTYQFFDFEPNDVTLTQVQCGGGGIVGDVNIYTYYVTPTVADNPFGDPWALIQVDEQYIPGGYNPNNDLFYAWEIHVASGMFIPNANEPRPIKNIFVEIRYDPYLTDYWVEAPDDSYVVTEVSSPEDPCDSTGWYIAEIEWQIRPNPTYETIWLTFEDDGTKLDYIKVWTQCVPAPGAILLGGIGVGLVGWLRNRKTI